MSTLELDELIAKTVASMTTIHPDHAILAGRIAVSKLHKETKKTFSSVMRDLYHNALISDETYRVIRAHRRVLNSTIDYTRDYGYNYFGFKTLECSYLLRIDGKVVECPQYMLMRVAVGIHGNDIQAAIETYELMSKKYFTHASPTLFNAGTAHPQLSSCFLVTMKEDSIEGIYDTIKTCAVISKHAGGIGINIHNIRSSGSRVAGTNGYSNGIVPMIRVFNDTARYCVQGGGKRPGAFAIYLEPWHPDVFDFIDLKKNTGSEEQRARDLFYALWIPDLFMERVKVDADWSLFDPHEAPDLHEVYGKEFETLYQRYEFEGRARKIVKARDLWHAIIVSQIETGTPYMMYKDACNRKSNQKNLGTIKCSNLCTEIVEYSSPDEVAVCNLASLALPTFVSSNGESYDFQKLHDVAKVVTRNLNRIIDINYYPVEEARNSNFRHRPIGLGVQGLADVFMMMGYSFDSKEARELNLRISETIYHAALEASCDLAERDGPYQTYKGSPVSEGVLQYDMWGVKPTDLWDWKGLKTKIAKHGVRNSLLVAPMPTASTSQILGFNECFEPYTSNIYTRRVLSGEFQVVNSWLVRDLVAHGIWNEDMRNAIISEQGSIQRIRGIPDRIKEKYRTIWELSQKTIIDMAADRGPFVDQSQSMNLFLRTPTYASASSMHFYAWEKGLKTGMYYLRSRPAVDAIQFTVDKETANQMIENSDTRDVDMDLEAAKLACSIDNKDACVMCSG